MKRLTLKGKNRIWPTVTWPETSIVVFYFSEDDTKVEIKETQGIDFEEFFLHLDRGGSIFVTLKNSSELVPKLVENIEQFGPLDASCTL
jgi:hypothetical protein